MRWLFEGVYNHPIMFTFALFRSAIATKKLTSSFYPLRVRIGIGQSLSIHLGRNASVVIKGILNVQSWGGSTAESSIFCGDGSSLVFGGDFEIGPGVHIVTARDARLSFGGKKNFSASGITSNTRIMVEKLVEIGADCIIAWDVFISDSDWHSIEGQQRVEPVSIGHHCWIAHGVSVLKGAVIPAGCIVGAKSLISKGFDSEEVMIAGNPARIVRNAVRWSR